MDNDRRRRFVEYFAGKPFEGDRKKLIAKTGLTKGRVAQYFDEKQAFGERAARALALRLGLPGQYFESDQPERAQGEAQQPDPRPPPPPMRNVRPVWVVGRTQGGWPERVWGDGGYPVGATDKYAEVSTTDQYAFACRVVGDSMVPRYMPGEFALVEPSTSPELEDDVLVRLTSGETMLKRLLSRRGGVRLGSYNGGEVLNFDEGEITWMYYVAHPIPARKIKLRVDVDPEHLDHDVHGDDEGHQQTPYQDKSQPSDHLLGGVSAFGDLDEVPTPIPSRKIGPR